MSGQAQIEITSPVEIWIENASNIAGQGLVSTGEDPPGPTVYASGDLELRGTSDFHGVLVAPTSTVDLRGTANSYGAIVTDQLDIGGTGAIHQDESLPITQSKEVAAEMRLVR